jgi:hypothetical protein
MRRTVWTLWIAGLSLKLLSSAWDVSWHFRLLRESVSPPHVINVVGFLLISLALLLSWRERDEATQPALNVILAGFAVFLAAIPFDEAWHRIMGLDLTTWSPSHLMLFYGTVVTIAGVVLLFLAEAGWRPGTRVREARLTRGQWGVFLLLLLFLYEALAFPLGYNEYTVVGTWNHLHGNSLYVVGLEIQGYADMVPDPSYGGLPHVLYPAYALAAGILFAVLVRQATGVRGTALAVLAAFAVERFAANAVLAATGWPTSAIPWHVVAIGLAVEMAWLVAEGAAQRLVVTLALAVGGSYAYWALASRFLFTVPLDWATVPWATLASGLAFLAALAVAERLGPMVEWANRDPTPYAGARAEAWLTARR